IFDAYWHGRGMRRRQTITGTPVESRASLRRLAAAEPTAGPRSAPDHVERREGDAGDAANRSGRREGASRTETIGRTDLRHIAAPDDVAEAHALAARLARAMRARIVRREQVRRRGRRLDLRRTIHRSIAHGGTPIELIWRRRKIKPLRLVVLLDAS